MRRRNISTGQEMSLTTEQDKTAIERPMVIKDKIIRVRTMRLHSAPIESFLIVRSTQAKYFKNHKMEVDF